MPDTTSRLRAAARIGLGATLLFTGTSHLTWARGEFRNQVPPWLPLDPDVVVLASGAAELALGAALIASKRRRRTVGWVTAAFFAAIFPGNIAQYAEHRDAFGLNSDNARLARLFFQPVLIAWALWLTRDRAEDVT